MVFSILGTEDTEIKRKEIPWRKTMTVSSRLMTVNFDPQVDKRHHGRTHRVMKFSRV